MNFATVKKLSRRYLCVVGFGSREYRCVCGLLKSDVSRCPTNKKTTNNAPAQVGVADCSNVMDKSMLFIIEELWTNYGRGH